MKNLFKNLSIFLLVPFSFILMGCPSHDTHIHTHTHNHTHTHTNVEMEKGSDDNSKSEDKEGRDYDGTSDLRDTGREGDKGDHTADK